MLVKLLCLLLNYWLSYREINLNIEKIQLHEKVDRYSSLEEGLMLSRSSFKEGSSLIIMGHSGIGPLALFNDIILLDIGDMIEVEKDNNTYQYFVTNKKTFKKGSNMILSNQSDRLYLVTCDLNDYTLQWLIEAKL